MRTNFCIGCGAPLENNQNFTAKKCSYCGLENSYITPKREKFKTFFQKFFSFKTTFVPKRNNKSSETEEKYRERIKTTVDNQIAQTQKKEINKNKKLREKDSIGIFWKKNTNNKKWFFRRKLIFVLIGATVFASVGGYFSKRYPNLFSINDIEFNSEFKTNKLSAYEYGIKIERLLDDEEYLKAYRLSNEAIETYPNFTNFSKFKLLRGIAGHKDGGRTSSLSDFNIGLSEYCKGKTTDLYCGWGYSSRAFLNYENGFIKLAIKDATKAVSFDEENHFRHFDLVKILFMTKKFKNFSSISEIAVSKFENYKNTYGLDDYNKEALIDLYLMQAKYYALYDGKNEKPRKRYKKALAILDKIFKLDENNEEAILLKDSVRNSLCAMEAWNILCKV